MYEHIPDSTNTYILVTPEDLSKFGIKVGLWATAGTVAMIGFAYWWEMNEDDRKANRRHKKAMKEMEERQRAERLQENRAAESA